MNLKVRLRAALITLLMSFRLPCHGGEAQILIWKRVYDHNFQLLNRN